MPSPEALFSVYPGLPELKKATYQPPLFEDSTHQLWHCDTGAGPMMLKLCQFQNLADSACWQVIERLFGLYLPDYLANMSDVRQLLLARGSLPIPEVHACSHQTEQWPGFMLAQFISGQRLTSERVTDKIVLQLAQQLASLHQYQTSHWGDLLNPGFEATHWSRQLIATLQAHVTDQHWLEQGMKALAEFVPSTFCPIMLDNRWDQYLFDGERITALVDIDAFVTGPAELELVLLEYQLNPSQATLFANTYQNIRPMPELNPCRLAYRLLLFTMNALGETELERWMNAESYWR